MGQSKARVKGRERGDTLQQLWNSPISSGAGKSSTATFSSRYGIGSFILALCGLFVLGTFIVLSTVKHYFGTHEVDLLTLNEVQSSAAYEGTLLFDPTLTAEQAKEEARQGLKREKIPRIIHQTWKNDVLPERWEAVKEECQRMLPDFEFKLWSDESARDFIEHEYPAFLPTWDSYPYNIQRADAIRYFVLHRYGGIYMDLDIGCRAHPGPLLQFETILPITKPVGVSNDLMFSAPRTPFMDMVIRSLEGFNHKWLWMNYPTVMFSTGPMYISAMYSKWSRSNKASRSITHPPRDDRIRLLPKSLYGKNAPPDEVPNSFFWHYYGSSWHAGDAGFIGFLGKYGYRLLLLGSSLVIIGFCYLAWTKRYYVMLSPKPRKTSLLEPLELVSQSNPNLSEEDRTRDSLHPSVQRFLGSFVPNFLTPKSDSQGTYSPVATSNSIFDLRVRPPSQALTSQEIASVLAPAPQTRPHPTTSKPHGRQRSRDVERGSPIRSRSGSNQPPDTTYNNYGNTTYLNRAHIESPQTSAATSAVRPTLGRRTYSPEALSEARPRSSSRTRFEEDEAHTSIPLHASPTSHGRFPSSPPLSSPYPARTPRDYRKSPSSSDVAAPRMPRRQPTFRPDDSDAEVSASELMDLLTELEPVVSASGRQIPNAVPTDDHTRMMRKRSLSSDGSEFQPKSR